MAHDIADLLDGAVENIINKNARGQTHFRNPGAFTGTSQQGTSRGHTCGSWTVSDSSARGAVGSTTGVTFWSGRSMGKCGERRRLYCFQTPVEVSVDNTAAFVDAMSNPAITHVTVLRGSLFHISKGIDLSGHSKTVSCITGKEIECNIDGQFSCQECIIDGQLLPPFQSGIFTDGTAHTSIEFRDFTFRKFTTSATDASLGDNSAILLRGEQTKAVFRSCFFLSNESLNSHGGAIRTLEGVTLEVYDSTFRANKAYSAGGAINAGFQDGIIRGSVLIDGCTFDENEAVQSGDGYNGGALGAAHLLTVTLRNSLFQNNINHEGYSGAVDIEEAKAEVINCSFIGNSGHYGGGLDIFNTKEIMGDVYPESTFMVRVADCNFVSNYADDDAGAFWLGPFGRVEISNILMDQNEANDDGGAMYIDDWSEVPMASLLLDNVECTNNLAGYHGGCIGIDGESATDITIKDSIFAGNVAGDAGGAIRSFDPLNLIGNKNSTITKPEVLAVIMLKFAMTPPVAQTVPPCFPTRRLPN